MGGPRFTGTFLSAALVLLTWMGTPGFAVALPPAEEVIERALVEEEALAPARDLILSGSTGEWTRVRSAISTANRSLRQVTPQVTELDRRGNTPRERG